MRLGSIGLSRRVFWKLIRRPRFSPFVGRLQCCRNLNSTYFVIADISGYTRFLAGVELDHAQDIVADLMDTVVKGVKPPFRLAKFEGDAAFVYAATAKVDGSMLQDAIESAYFKFRRRLRDIKKASVCECKACAAMGDLDFKFVAHHGETVKQRMGGREELAGRDVILVHRLLKNTASEKVGSRAYALYSEACIQAAGIDPAAQGLVEHHQTIDIMGDVKVWLRNLEEAWVNENEKTRVEVTPDDAYRIFGFEIAAPHQTVWEHLTVPGQFARWWPTDAVIENSSNGRRGTGTRNHCMHGKDAIVEEILDWRPFDYLTVSVLLPIPGAPKLVMTRAVQEQANGATRLEMRLAKPKPKDMAFVDQLAPTFEQNLTTAIETLRRLLDEAPASDAAIEAAPPAPSRAATVDRAGEINA